MTLAISSGIDNVFAALSSPIRRELLRLLRDDGQQPVEQLASHFEMRRPSVSEHLKVLRDAGLVSEQRHGRQRLYHLEPVPLQEVQQWLAPYEQFWRERISNLTIVLQEEDNGQQGND